MTWFWQKFGYAAFYNIYYGVLARVWYAAFYNKNYRFLARVWVCSFGSVWWPKLHVYLMYYHNAARAGGIKPIMLPLNP